jgi:hypothetical protein
MSEDREGGGHTAGSAVYAQVSDNYRAIDDLRLRLLALLPLATGTGILVLLRGDGLSGHVAAPVGLFGMVATLSLYFYELHGVEKCAHFIHRGAELERQMGVRGSFRYRPHAIFGVVSELLPSVLIYPASFAGWVFVALYAVDRTWLGAEVRTSVAIAVLGVGVATSAAIVFIMEKTRPARRKNLEQREDESMAQEARQPKWHEPEPTEDCPSPTAGSVRFFEILRSTLSVLSVTP